MEGESLLSVAQARKRLAKVSWIHFAIWVGWIVGSLVGAGMAGIDSTLETVGLVVGGLVVIPLLIWLGSVGIDRMWLSRGKG